MHAASSTWNELASFIVMGSVVRECVDEFPAADFQWILEMLGALGSSDDELSWEDLTVLHVFDDVFVIQDYGGIFGSAAVNVYFVEITDHGERAALVFCIEKREPGSTLPPYLRAKAVARRTSYVDGHTKGDSSTIVIRRRVGLSARQGGSEDVADRQGF